MLPFIYLVIELKESFGLNLGIIGILIGAFVLCRVLAIDGSIFSTRISHFTGTLLGLFGMLPSFCILILQTCMSLCALILYPDFPKLWHLSLST